MALEDFLVDFYSQKTDKTLDENKIKEINSYYGDNPDSLITDLYSKYDPEGLDDAKLNEIKSFYFTDIKEPKNKKPVSEDLESDTITLKDWNRSEEDFMSDKKIQEKLKKIYPNFSFEESTYDINGISVTNNNTKQTKSFDLQAFGGVSDYEDFIKFVNADISKEETKVLSRTSLEKNKDGLYDIRINEPTKEDFLPDYSFIGGPSGTTKRKANEEEALKAIDVLDSLQKNAFNNLDKYGVLPQDALAAQTFTLSTEDNRKIKDTLYEEFKSKLGLDVERSSFDNLYNSLYSVNKNLVEQEYNESKIRPETTTIDKDFENNFAKQADIGKSNEQLQIESLKSKQGDITEEINLIDYKIKQATNDQEINENQRNIKLNDFTNSKQNLLQEYNNIDSKIESLATKTVYNNQRVAGDPLSFRPKVVSYKRTNRELTADFFNAQGNSEETVARMTKVAEEANNTAGIRAQNIINSNPGISQRGAVKELYNEEILYLQQLKADARNKFVNIHFTEQQ